MVSSCQSSVPGIGVTQLLITPWLWLVTVLLSWSTVVALLRVVFVVVPAIGRVRDALILKFLCPV